MKLLNSFKALFRRRPPIPPYEHITQLGDPVLRIKCRPVEKQELQSPEMKKLFLRMKKAVKRYKCAGVAAPQLGVDVSVFAMNFPEVDGFYGSPVEYNLKEMKPYSYSVWVNPSIKVLDYTKVTFPEGCESMRGFCAEVPRYTSIQLSGWDEHGQDKTEQLSGWLARIAQHEMDHLNGKLFLDLAVMSSLTSTFWDRVNQTGGRVHLCYLPDKFLSKG